MTLTPLCTTHLVDEFDPPGATHLVAAVASVLRHGPRVEELQCGGMVGVVREAFAEAMTSVVQVW